MNTPAALNHIITVPLATSPAGLRLDKYLAAQIPQYTRSHLQQLICKGCVTVNNLVTTKNGLLVQEGDAITITLPVPEKHILTKIEGVEAKIIHEHPHFFIVYKPAGLLVHTPSSYSTEVTLVDWLLQYYQEVAEVGAADRPGIVHRLDKNTSGLMVIARTHHAFAVFSQLFHDRLITKRYYAIVHGHPSKTGLIDHLLGRDPKHRFKKKAFASGTEPHKLPHDIRQALTRYESIEYFKNHTWMDIQLLTGRTHQIRAHFAGIKHPLVGDEVYGTNDSLLNRQALHAYALAFSFDGEQYAFNCPMPVDMEALITALRS